MGRVSNPGAPQRVSAHVVTKEASFPGEDEEEKTTIESGGWEEEASTTVEQGEVADKLRALTAAAGPGRPATSITATTASGVPEDPTPDDQRAGATLAQLAPARLLVTKGNDAGRVLEVRAGKTYTIGRGIDNDLVLADIAVSRKHFDLRNENGIWIAADRGSGNGTLINQRIEDAPFQLATGDAIEVGNTAFRFELVASAISLPGLPREVPKAAPVMGSERRGNPQDPGYEPATVRDTSPPPPGSPRTRSPGAPAIARDVAPSLPLSAAAHAAVDDYEVPSAMPSYDSAVGDEIERSIPSGTPMMFGESPRLPGVGNPIAPPMAAGPRPRSPTARPSAGLAVERQSPRSLQLAAQGAPLSLAAMGSPTSPLHVPALAPGLGTPQPQAPLPPAVNRPPLAPGMLLDAPLGALPSTLPGQGPTLPPHSGRMPFYSGPEGTRQSGPLRARTLPGVPPRDGTSTALVQPISYSGAPAAIAPRPVHLRVPRLSRRTKLVFGGAAVCTAGAVTAIAIILSVFRGSDSEDRAKHASGPNGDLASSAKPAAPSPTPSASPPVAPAPGDHSDTPAAAGADDVVLSPAVPAVPQTLKRAPLPGDPAPGSAEPASSAPPPVVTANPDRVASSDSLPGERDASPPVVRETRPDPSPARGDRRPPRRTEPRKVEKAERGDRGDRAEKLDKPSKRIAEADRPEKRRGRSAKDLETEASALYRGKNFNGAAALLTQQLSGFTGDDAKEIKSLASIYSQFGKAYNNGMAPGTKSVEALPALQRALEYDTKDLGGHFTDELKEKLGPVASRAATSFMAAKDYVSAFQAVHASESVGGTSERNNKVVRQLLEEHAQEQMKAAKAELASNPDAAKKKLREVRDIVEPNRPLHQQAQKLLNGS